MKYALVIGNTVYDDSKLTQLKAPKADSIALATALEDEKIGNFDSVISLVDKNDYDIRIEISSFFANKKPDDLLLLYFTGHGVLDERGRLFLAFKNTKTNHLLNATAIPSSFIADEMDSCRSKRQILILDCCNSGSFERSTKGRQKAMTEDTFRGNGYGHVVLTATDSTQYAFEGDQVIPQTELSLFTHFLIAGMRTGDADKDNDGNISIDELYDYVYEQIMYATPKQIPQKWSYKQEGRLIIAKNPQFELRTITSEVPTTALELYKRSRYFISAGDIQQTKQLLKEAIVIAQNRGSQFPQAQELLDNLSNASVADSFKQKALEQLNAKQWAIAVVNLETAVNLDKTDETNKTLLSHLQSLIKAQGLLSQLNAGIQDRKQQIATIVEIQKIIDATNEPAVLSPLWQEVVRLFGEYDNKGKQGNIFIRNPAWSFLGAILLLIGALWLLYFNPRSKALVDCLKPNGLEVVVAYPSYIANGDKETVTFRFKNIGTDLIDGYVLFNSHGSAKIQFENQEGNKITIDELIPNEENSANIMLSLDEPFSIIADPSLYIDFNIAIDGNNSNCSSEKYHIAISPIYGLRKVVMFLWGTVGLTLIGLFWNPIKVFMGLDK